VNCERFPSIRPCASSWLPSVSCADSHLPRARSRSPEEARTASPRAIALAAAFDVLAAVWGRGTKAASPTRSVRLKTIRGTARSTIGCRNGSRVACHSARNGGASSSCATSFCWAKNWAETCPGGTEKSHNLPSRPALARHSRTDTEILVG
jgi:hypothetical protein